MVAGQNDVNDPQLTSVGIVLTLDLFRRPRTWVTSRKYSRPANHGNSKRVLACEC
jgi:hypothetical protein